MLTPDNERCLGTVHGGIPGDSTGTGLFSLDLTGRTRWTQNLGPIERPKVSYLSDGRILIDDLSGGIWGRPNWVVLLSPDGELINSCRMQQFFRPTKEAVYFADADLRRLDWARPERAVRIEPEELYPFLLNEPTSFPVLRMLWHVAPARFHDDPKLVEIVRAMRADSTFARALFSFDTWVEDRKERGTE